MIGERLRQARLLAGLTQGQVVARLSELGVGLTKAGLSKYERGGSSPKARLLLNLARVLGVRSDYFLKEPKVNVEWLGFRKLVALGKKRQERIKAMACEVVEKQVWLQEKLYPRGVPSFPKAQEVHTSEEVEVAAAQLRKRWKLGNDPIESLVETIEGRGGIVVECTEDEKKFHGLSGWANRRYPVMVVGGTAADDRRRFNLAHELGHLAMHCRGVEENEQEKLAHRFAAAFIVPATVARNELGKHRRNLTFPELMLLKRKHGLSMQAWMRRALDLGIISEGHFRTLRIQFSANGWRKKEPVEFAGRERPTRLRQMTLRALAEGLITSEKAEQFCPRCTEGIEEQGSKRPALYLSALEVMKLPKPDRERILAEAAALAEKQYKFNRELTDFEAFDEKDFYDESE